MAADISAAADPPPGAAVLTGDAARDLLARFGELLSDAVDLARERAAQAGASPAPPKDLH